MRILICDDTVQPLTGLKPALTGLVPGAVIDVVTGPDVVSVADGLEKRRRAAQTGAQDAPAWGTHDLDSVDVLILDYNFVQLEHANGLTGHRLAYLARCYSNAGYIVVLNQFGENRFDLTLNGHTSTFADVQLGLRQIVNPGLWSDEDWPAFRPWSWPVVPADRARLNRLTEKVAADLDGGVLAHLQLGDRAGALSRTTRQFLFDDSVTFRRFVLESGNGFETSDLPFGDEVLPRLAAARLTKWLEHVVFTGQDLLIDAPRLLSRYPSLISSSDLVELVDVPLTRDWQNKLHLGYADDQRYAPVDWLSRPAWWRSGLLADERIAENLEATSPDLDVRFAEDASRFLPDADVDGFVADLVTPFVQRFVRRDRDEAVEYQPELRFSL
jgi:hypothetical protein